MNSNTEVRFPALTDLMHTSVKFTHNVKCIEAAVDIFPTLTGEYHAPVVKRGGRYWVARLPVGESHYSAMYPFVSSIK